MTSKRHSPANRTQVARTHAIWDALLEEVLQCGIHGYARLELTITDGTIQRIVRTVEKIEKVH